MGLVLTRRIEYQIYLSICRVKEQIRASHQRVRVGADIGCQTVQNSYNRHIEFKAIIFLSYFYSLQDTTEFTFYAFYFKILLRAYKLLRNRAIFEEKHIRCAAILTVIQRCHHAESFPPQVCEKLPPVNVS